MRQLLYDVVLEKKQAGSQIAANPTLDAMNGDYCKILDSLVPSDGYISDRVKKTLTELELAGGIDYNDHYRSAYDAYNEAICYYLMRYEKGFNVMPIQEQSDPTPDFEIEFIYKNWKGEDVTNRVFVEVKSLSFAEGNLQYKQVQQDSLESNVELEEQRNRGKKICSSFYEVSPLGRKGSGLTFEIEELNKKINNNIKQSQYQYGNGNDTFLFVDLSQYMFPFNMKECLPVYPDLRHKNSVSGRLWNIAFGDEGDRVFLNCEFEGKGNFDKKLSLPGILNCHPYIKGIIFSSGVEPGKRFLFGFYRYNEQDPSQVAFMDQLCSFCNDDCNSNGFKFFDTLFK